ncbi:A/G-specific adenine glycosylase [Salinimicrobium sediminilitoris]|uniref:A/G-specific adenine glycosylase n=1 Tax=Salinimicrobium sediminilitoris TaxID=2876715 RepID=UPI001E615782|nr:A/G-specific adenine glycosylase [Salinimicrobium sediminilitoris]MCC8359273.1 A/G-specific adenine glycosylase [Salinimicrobium sediminilitoris]
MSFDKKLIYWYLENKRDLPWRATKDPYQIWLSEIILQQTRVEQGKPYYFKFLEAFPTVFSLANASEEEVLKLWQGLGYYSRARNLHFTAQYIAFDLGGRFPASYKELVKLKGVGDYTAAAIASICYDEPQAAVDGNVYRVLARIFGIDTPTNSSQGIKQFRNLAQDLISREDPANFNQALIEFGSEQCKPRNPLCNSCPFSTRCVAFNQNRINELPVKLKKLKVKKRHFNYLVYVSEEGKTIMQQRRGKGIWEGLYEFPLVETTTEAGLEHLVEEVPAAYVTSNKKPLLFNEVPIVHKLTHQHIYTKFWILECKELPQEALSLAEVNKLPVPVLIENFIDTFDF